ncbi:hypothetical protein Tco_0416191, partial [Tanacetum coccineum]
DGLKYGLAARLNQPAETDVGFLDQGRPNLTRHRATRRTGWEGHRFGLLAELTGGLFLLAAGSNPLAVIDADEFLLPAGTDAALDLQGIESTQL